MNITKMEYTIIMDILADEDYPEDVAPERPLTIVEAKAPVDTEEEEEEEEEEEGNVVPNSGEPPAKKQKKAGQLTVYQWKFVHGTTGEVLKVSDDIFLDSAQCMLDGDDHAPDVTGNCDTMPTLKLKKINFPQPTAEGLVSGVYRYLMNLEFKTRVKQHCYGCQNDKGSQVDHMSDGCLDDRESLVNLHARACHLRISTPRLHLATEAMQIYFPEVKVPYRVYLTLLKNVKPERVLNEH